MQLYFPQVAQDGVAKQQKVQAQALLPINNSAYTILFVDDEAGIRNLVSAMLRKEGFTVVEAVNGQDAIAKCQQLGTIDLLLTDIVMPAMGGVALNAKLKTMYTNLRTIFMSGFAPDAAINELIIDNNVSFLPKPFNSGDLLAMVNSVLSSP